MGNIQVEMREGGYVPIEDFTYVMPQDMRDSALVDRVYGMIPGWELPKIGRSAYHLSRGYGMASDYFCEVLHDMRKLSFGHIIEQEVELVGDYTIRDEKSVKRVASGLLKLLIPNGSINRSELKAIMDVAVECRQRIVDWLHILAPGEFPKKRLEYKLR